MTSSHQRSGGGERRVVGSLFARGEGMAPDPRVSMHGRDVSNKTLNRLLAGMSLFTMAMTVPQVWNVWVSRQTSGVSLWSWGAYLASAFLWLWHGLRERDKNIYLPCIGWALLDAAVIAGVVLHATG